MASELDPMFELYLETALVNRDFGQDLVSEDPKRIVPLTTSRVDVINLRTEQVLPFCKYSKCHFQVRDLLWF
jgi:hypothetical protein